MAGHALSIALTAWAGTLSLVAFLVMVHDKRAARRAGRRVPESRLLLLSLVGGAWGAWAAMSLARHKTRHLRFRILVPAAAALWTVLVVAAWLGRLAILI